MWKHQVDSNWREYNLTDGTPLGVIGATEINDGCHVEASDIMADTDKGCSWNEQSGRYKVLEPVFYMPDVARRNTAVDKQASANDGELTGVMHQWMEHALYAATNAYQAMLDNGVAKELARLVLPPSIYSECYWTVSLQAVLHFLEQRLDSHAQFEIREYAQGVLELIHPTLEGMGVEFSQA
jgi:flavin-dependent thymidylate synthase